MEESVIWLACRASWEPSEEASGNSWPLGFGTGRVHCRIQGICAADMQQLLCLEVFSTVILSGSTCCTTVKSFITTSPDRAGHSEAPQPAARKQISYHPRDPRHATAWKKTDGSTHMALVSSLKAYFQQCMCEIPRWSVAGAQLPLVPSERQTRVDNRSSWL